MEQEAQEPIDVALAKLAASQHGVVTRTEALSLGLTPSAIDRRCRKGVLRRLHDGVYAHAAVPAGLRQTLLAICRWAGGGTAASHRSAAHLWRFDGYDDSILEISGPRRLRSSKVISHVTIPIPIEDMRQVEGIPVTSPERTLVELAAVEGPDRLEDALDTALRRRLTTVRRMQLRVRAEGGRKGIGKLRKLLAERDGEGRPSESRFETRLHRVLDDHGLPPTRQFTIWNGGDFVARVDFCFVEAKLIVEADGYQWHSSRRAWQRDRERRNELTEMGWRVIQLTWDDVTRHAARTVERLRALLQPQLPLSM